MFAYLCSMSLHLMILISGLLLPVAALKTFPGMTRVLLRDLRFPRILHYISLAGMGMSLHLRTKALEQMMMQELLLLLIFAVALSYAAVFAIITNNIEDLEADIISNPDRPLVQRSIELKPYRNTGWICLLIACLIAGSAHKDMMAGVLIISAGYYIYSCRPFRLKRFPLIAKLIIGINSLAVAVCGFVLAGGHLTDFPLIWAFFILIPLSLAANFVDLKDIRGDGATGIRTLPVLLGLEKARYIISFCTVIAYGMAAFLLNISWLYPLVLLLTVLHLWALYHKPYEEKYVFLIYVSALFGLDIFLFISKSQFF